jgi:hypothetical protein
VESRLVPDETIIGLLSSPLMIILTSPEFTSLDCAKRRINTSSRIIAVNATMEVIITEPMNSYFLFFVGKPRFWEHKYIY